MWSARAPCHTSIRSQILLEEHLPYWSKDMLPPSSPVLNPLDYSEWSFMKIKAVTTQLMSDICLSPYDQYLPIV